MTTEPTLPDAPAPDQPKVYCIPGCLFRFQPKHLADRRGRKIHLCFLCASRKRSRPFRSDIGLTDHMLQYHADDFQHTPDAPSTAEDPS